jgi:hypothetical protein
MNYYKFINFIGDFTLETKNFYSFFSSSSLPTSRLRMQQEPVADAAD